MFANKSVALAINKSRLYFRSDSSRKKIHRKNSLFFSNMCRHQISFIDYIHAYRKQRHRQHTRVQKQRHRQHTRVQKQRHRQHTRVQKQRLYGSRCIRGRDRAGQQDTCSRCRNERFLGAHCPAKKAQEEVAIARRHEASDYTSSTCTIGEGRWLHTAWFVRESAAQTAKEQSLRFGHVHSWTLSWTLSTAN
jgi:hypothetical protein